MVSRTFATVSRPSRYWLTCCDQRTWCLVFQYIPVSFIVAVVTDISQAVGKYCINGHSVHFAHIWVRNSSPHQSTSCSLTPRLTVNNHPHHLRRHRLPAITTILQVPPHRAQRPPRRPQALRDQRHRLPSHATDLHLRHPLLHRRRETQPDTLLRRLLLRHPRDPHLRRNGALLSLQLLRLQRQALHPNFVWRGQ